MSHWDFSQYVLDSLTLKYVVLATITSQVVDDVTYASLPCKHRSLDAVEVNSLSSYDTELPYEYYSLPFCKPEDGVKKSTSSVNPGTILSGLKMFNSPYTFKVKVWLA